MTRFVSVISTFFQNKYSAVFCELILLSRVESCLNNLTSKEAKGYNQPSGWLN